ncbi:universal stress protein [Geomonas subterranea]|uniref:Universal stress protein n=2 Tax=Geomonas subterranea TaxID=2847989 RepID=A0ABX8LMT0_9BACT|nr:universal stress protein [Geomonas subterranea]QXE91629.1 universal stress protein [Geomonas subterranea]QXM10279.1 universal stress protein [Geomonas subterranea]
MFRHLLVPTDGSPLSQEAVTRAISFASEAGARITFFCAVQPLPKMYFAEGAIFDAHTCTAYREKMVEAANEILDAAQKRAEAAGVACGKAALLSTEPYEAIIEAATENECDLIFMASHGRRGISGFLLGSETQKVLTHSTIPVLVHRSTDQVA